MQIYIFVAIDCLNVTYIVENLPFLYDYVTGYTPILIKLYSFESGSNNCYFIHNTHTHRDVKHKVATQV
jgi:hypothetical protein